MIFAVIGLVKQYLEWWKFRWYEIAVPWGTAYIDASGSKIFLKILRK
jgi:hypothetical protein